MDRRQEESDPIKKDILHRQGINAFYSGVSDTFKFLAGISTAIGMASFIPFLSPLVAGIGKTSAMVAFKSLMAGTLPATASAIAAGGATVVGGTLAMTGIAILGAAVLFTALAVGSDYVGRHYYFSANYDTVEVNARHTAKYVAEELERNTPQRADGKSWSIAMRERQEQPAARQI